MLSSSKFREFPFENGKQEYDSISSGNFCQVWSL